MTTASPRKARGSYPKGVARRAEILQAALEAYASSGHTGPSLKSIAEAVGLSEPALLHYFPSREHLLVEVLVARDTADLARYDLVDLREVWDLMRHTTETPGLVKLFVDMSAASADPNHPAHEFMKNRSQQLGVRLADGLGLPRDDWRVPVLIAAAEGLQIQWLRDPTVDLVGDLQKLFAVLMPG